MVLVKCRSAAQVWGVGGLKYIVLGSYCIYRLPNSFQLYAPAFSGREEERVGDQPHSLRVENLFWMLNINNYGDQQK